MRQTIGGCQCKFEGGGIGNAAAIEVGSLNVLFTLRQDFNLRRRAVQTSTARIFNERRTADSSRRMLAKFSLVTIAPSMLMTNIFSRKRGMYCRMPRRSVSFTLLMPGYLSPNY